MKLITSKMSQGFIIILIVLGYVGYLASCTNEDQIIEPAQVVNSETDLLSVKVTLAPTIDGSVDAMWENSPILEFSTAVPEVTGDIFRGYTGNIIPTVKLRSAYDDANIYFLAEWSDPTESITRQPWYFDPTTKKWAQERGTYTFSASGTITRPPFYEDKVGMLWNVNNSVSGWNSGTCYKSCHTGLPATDGSSRHFTNFATEKIDMWHWKSVRGGTNGGFQFDDQFQDNAYPNGRKSDPGAGAYADNRQTLGDVLAPKYVIPGRTNNRWILGSEITDGTAKTVTAVDANGVLTLSDATTIDPNVGTDYQRVGTGLGAKAIAGINITAYDGSRGDITCKATYDPTNKAWTMEFKRALNTGDAVNDVDFSALTDQYFGFAIFENAQIAHSIKPNLVLKFKK